MFDKKYIINVSKKHLYKKIHHVTNKIKICDQKGNKI
jgi:hypothetical protein